MHRQLLVALAGLTAHYIYSWHAVKHDMLPPSVANRACASGNMMMNLYIKCGSKTAAANLADLHAIQVQMQVRDCSQVAQSEIQSCKYHC
jgi:hypothetical protein